MNELVQVICNLDLALEHKKILIYSFIFLKHTIKLKFIDIHLLFIYKTFKFEIGYMIILILEPFPIENRYKLANSTTMIF